MTAMSLMQDTANESYLDVERLVNGCVWRFIKKYGGEFEEVKASADLLFAVAFRTFDPAKARLTTWVQYRIERGLGDLLHKKMEKDKRLTQVPADLNLQIHHEKFDVEAFCKELSADAAHVVEMLVNDVPWSNNPLRVKKALEHVLQAEGWTWGRIRKSFNEIRSALQ